MDSGMDPEQRVSHNELIVALSQVVGDLVEENQGNAIGLVEVLRLLERLHRGITEGAFQDALPQNRQQLYKLMRIIEEEGGWPHIPKMRLQMLYSHLIESSDEDASSEMTDDRSM
jgi:hypothetical protein